jgi:hypothetical protein
VTDAPCAFGDRPGVLDPIGVGDGQELTVQSDRDGHVARSTAAGLRPPRRARPRPFDLVSPQSWWDELRGATGDTKLPALKLDDGPVITHARAIVARGSR